MRKWVYYTKKNEWNSVLLYNNGNSFCNFQLNRLNSFSGVEGQPDIYPIERRMTDWAQNLRIALTMSVKIIKTSDSSDKWCQHLEIWNRFNPHETSIFPTLSLPFFVTISSLPPYSHRSIWVSNGSNLRITCDNIYTNLNHKLDIVTL